MAQALQQQPVYYSETCAIVVVQLLSCVQQFVDPRTAAYWAPLSMGFLKQQYWSVLLFPSSGDLPDPGITPGSYIGMHSH